MKTKQLTEHFSKFDGSAIKYQLGLTDFKFTGIETLKDGDKNIIVGRFEGFANSVHVLGEKFRSFVWFLDAEGYRWHNVPGKGLKRISPSSVFEIYMK